MPNKSLIAPLNTGLQKVPEPWLIPEDAFEFLNNAYIWRGRLKKRFGSTLIGSNDLNSRLRINIGTTAAVTGNFAGVAPGAIFKVGQTFSIGTTVFTVNALGAPAPLLTTGTATGTFNTTTGALTITGNNENPSTAVYFYPSEPVMGIRPREQDNINFEDVIAFDTQFAYFRVAAAWERLGTAIWTGTNTNFYWSTNYRGANPYETFFYVVNYVAADQINYIPSGSTTWTQLRPQLDAGATRFLESARIIIGYKDRLLCLNTRETDGGIQLFQNRVRWSQNGDPTAAATAWLDDTPGRGGYVDAPTQQAIISVEFIKDELIVYFERSTWKLVYSGDAALPFFWRQINNELGCESTFSIVGFDSAAVGIGNVGIHTTNSVNVQRIDDKIPDEVFNIHNGNEGPARVYGIRDYYRELVYWTFPDAESNPIYPTRVLVWNYKNDSWAFNDDSFTCFGPFQQDNDLTWGTVGDIYGTWGNWNVPWGSPVNQSEFEFVAAGNQQGYVFLINTDVSENAQSLTITDANAALQQLTIIDHNLKEDDYILIQEAQGLSNLNGLVFQVLRIDANTIELVESSFTGTYTGAGKLSRVSNYDIRSKQWNPGTVQDMQFRLLYIDFLCKQTTAGEVSIDFLLDSSQAPEEFNEEVLLGSKVLSTQEEPLMGSQLDQERIWHRFFFPHQGQFIQIKIFMSDEQMKDLAISQSPFELSAILLTTENVGRLI